MLKILNEYYYLDLDKMEEMVNLPSKNKPEGEESESVEQHISVVKYDMIKIMIDVILTEQNEVDEALGPKSDTSIPFKIAFNTLLNNQIIKKY
jgi:hypothetical protein